LAAEVTGSASPLIQRTTVVLCRPRKPGNVGAAARAVANHGAAELVLVAPRGYDPSVARWMAPGAAEVVDRARIVATAAEAVAHATLVVGTTARSRRWDWPVWSPAELVDAAPAAPAALAIVFGPEDMGLSNAELSVCDAAMRLPTAAHASLNLAMAVTVTLAWIQGLPSPEAHDSPPRLAAGLREGIVQDMLAALDQTPYGTAHPIEKTRNTLFRLLGTPGLGAREAGALRGMVKALRVALGSVPPPRGR
jgi:TrmH family RNA methyltransferase